MNAKMIKLTKHLTRRVWSFAFFCCFVSVTFSYSQTSLGSGTQATDPALTGTWGPMRKLRDNTDTWVNGKPEGGWWVSLIHATLSPNGDILASGMSRKAENGCFYGTRLHTAAKNGVSFVLNPREVQKSNLDPELAKGPIYVDPLRENGEFPEGGPLGRGNRDVLFCSGHSPIGNGQVLFSGGGRIGDLGTLDQGAIQGLNYARLYDSNTNEFSAVASDTEIYRFAGDQRFDQFWYPTNTRLGNGKVLIMAGFFEANGLVDPGFNRSLHLFDPDKLNTNENPFSLLSAHEDGVLAINAYPGGYPETVLLHRPMVIENTEYQVATIGVTGEVVLINVDPDTDQDRRFHVLPDRRPSENCPDHAGMRAGAVLSPSGEELIVIGGYKGAVLEDFQVDVSKGIGFEGEMLPKDDSEVVECDVASRADFYNFESGTWESAELRGSDGTPIVRPLNTAVLLPTGDILIANGGPNIPVAPGPSRLKPGKDDEEFPGVRNYQLLNPATREIFDLGEVPDDPFPRGYHNTALLTKDADIFISCGVTESNGQLSGCERPDIRFYQPPYLHTTGARPQWQSEDTISMDVNGEPINIPYNGAALKADGGVVLMALGSVTHGFDQNQRYIALDYDRNGNELSITPPANSSIAPKGDYILYLVAKSPSDAPAVASTGVPSLGRHVVLK